MSIPSDIYAYDSTVKVGSDGSGWCPETVLEADLDPILVRKVKYGKPLDCNKFFKACVQGRDTIMQLEYGWGPVDFVAIQADSDAPLLAQAAQPAMEPIVYVNNVMLIKLVETVGSAFIGVCDTNYNLEKAPYKAGAVSLVSDGTLIQDGQQTSKHHTSFQSGDVIEVSFSNNGRSFTWKVNDLAMPPVTDIATVNHLFSFFFFSLFPFVPHLFLI
jgi:hypothetical protein